MHRAACSWLRTTASACSSLASAKQLSLHSALDRGTLVDARLQGREGAEHDLVQLVWQHLAQLVLLGASEPQALRMRSS